MKSMFGNKMGENNKIRNIMGQQNDLFAWNELKYTTQYLNEIDQKYTCHLETRNYEKMNCDLIEYSELYEKIQKMSLKIKDPAIQILFKISLQGLTGAIHAFELNDRNIHMNLELMQIRNKSMIMNDVYENTENALEMIQTFTLAPLYSYYILLFGVPTHGFEPNKITKIMEVLNKHGIHPYV